MMFIMMKSTEETRTNTQKSIKVGTNPEKSQNQKEDKINNQNRIKDSEPLIEDTIKKKARKRTIEESIEAIRNQNKCSNQLANQAINEFLQQQERQMKKLILKKLMNLEMLQDNRDRIGNKINHQNKMEPTNIIYPEDDHNPDNIEIHNKDQEKSFNLDNIMSRILELKITRESEEANAHDDVQNTVKTKPNSEYIEETNAHDYVRNELNTESAEDIDVLEEKSGDKNVKSPQAKSKLSSAVIESNMEHSENVVTSSNSESGQSSTTKVQEGPSEHYSSSRCGRSPKTKRNHKINSEESLETKDNNCNKCSSSISDSARMENTKSDKLNKTPAPSSEESIQLETSAQFIKLLAEIQNDLIKLDYIKNYNNQEHSLTEEYINSTEAKNTQSKYFLVQKDINHMLISEESLEKITAQNPILNADIGIQSVQANPINQN